MSCEGNIGVGGGIGSGNPTIYVTGEGALNDIFLHLGGSPETCTWPIPATGGGTPVLAGHSGEWPVVFANYGNDVPVGAIIEGVNIVFYGGIANNPSTVGLTIYVVIGGTRYDLFTGTTSDPSYLQWSSGILAVKPSNNTPWTKAEILAATWGIEISGDAFFLVGVFAEVYWSESSSEGGLSITSVTPNSGPPAGGTTVAIVGTGFTTVYSVMFGTVAATSFTIDSATHITAVTPAHALGYADVVVSAS